MKKSLTLIVTVILVVMLIIVLLQVLQVNKNTQPKHLDFVLGVCTHGNESSEVYALSNGVRYLRTDISLSKSQEELLSMEHNIYNASYLGILDYETLPGGSSNRNWSLSEWNESVSNAVSSYPYISTWEIWNEPYVQNFETGYMNGSAYNYFMIIKSAANIIRARDPNATIVCFGGAPIADPQLMMWYERVWSYGAYKYCNAISIHAYPYGPALLSSLQMQAWRSSIYSYENFTHVPIWITEFGMPSSSAAAYGYTQQLQGMVMEQGFGLFNNISFVKRVYWYDLWGLSDGNLENNFGLLNLSNPLNGKPNLAWSIFKEAYNSSCSIAQCN
ncbi:MAG: glycosyl hydrolase [Candidatus Micrarchaeia archaeon]